MNRADIYKNYIGNFEAAIADYRKIIELDPNRVEPYILRVAGLAICAGTKKTIAYPWISRDVDCLLYNNIINNNEKYVYNTN
jgi:tetratricopeptide (TPR) repeat protein